VCEAVHDSPCSFAWLVQHLCPSTFWHMGPG
jgi:hypothetical protein